MLLKAIAEKIPTHAVIFDVSTDRGIRSGNQTLTEIMYGLFLQSLGYSKDLDLSELEIALEGEGRLVEFESVYRQRFAKDWNARQGASRVFSGPGERGDAPARTEDLSCCRLLGEGRQAAIRYQSGKARGSRQRAHEAKAPWSEPDVRRR